MIPTTRVAHRVPVSSSFPSGHSASAAAFAVGVGVEAPWLALPVGLLAAAVAYSRIYTGVHFASDVIAGVAIGATVAGAGALLVPAHQVEPRRAGTEPSRPQPPRPDGRGLVAIVNSGSGSVDERFVARLKEALPLAEVVEVGADDDVRQEIERAGARAEVLGVAGGDGTINCAASVAMSRGLPLLVFPAGTYNHFARDLDLTDLDDSVEAITTGRAIRIDVGEVDGEVFLNTASLGSYPEFVRTREALEGRFGKSVAAAISLVRVMRSGPALEATVDGRRRRLLLVFVGNGDYRPRGFLPRWRAALDTGDLDVRLADVSRPRSAWKLTAAALTANLYRTRSYVERRTPDLVVRFDGPGGLLARDGEVADAPAEVRFSVRRGALTVYRGRPSGSPGRS
jgi:undecaprenyl-diphosphatase